MQRDNKGFPLCAGIRVFILCHMIVVGYYGNMLAVCVSVRLSYICLFVFLFPDNTLSKCHWIFIKHGVCIDIVQVWFGIINRQISSILTELSAHDMSLFYFLDDNFSKCQWIFTKLGVCIDIMEIWFGIDDGQISSIF